MALPMMMKAPVGYISWGMQDSSHGFNAYSNNADRLVSEMKGDGFWGYAIQIIEENRNGAKAMNNAAKAQGFHRGGWTNIAQQAGDLESLHHIFDLIKESGVGFMNWNIEERWGLGGTDLNDLATVNNCHKVLCSEFRKRFPLMPATVQTNGGGFELRASGGGVAGGMDHEASAIYNKNHIYLNHEDYWVNSPNLTPSAGDFWGHDGWNGTGAKFTRPSISTAGIFPSETGRTDPQGNRLMNTIEMEIPRLAASGRHNIQHVWTIEYMSPDDRKHVGAKF
jgi:hypothetical protein